MKDLFAFWQYDKFPFCKGAKIEFIDVDGRIAIESDPSSLFTPFLILPLRKGEEVLKELNKLETAYQESLAMVKKTFKNKINKIIKLPK